MDQKAILEETDNGKMRRIMERNQTFNIAGFAIGDSALFYKQISRKGTQKWRGPATILGIDETRVAMKFQSQTFRIARNCVRKRATSSLATPIGARDLEEQDPAVNV